MHAAKVCGARHTWCGSEERDALAASCCVPALFALFQNVHCLLIATSDFSMHVITRILDFRGSSIVRTITSRAQHLVMLACR